MPYCKRCGELGRAEKCKKCGTSFSTSLSSISCDSSVDRWQSSKYLDQVVGSKKEEERQGPLKKTWMERRKLPSILVDKKYRVAPLHVPSPPTLPSTRPDQHSISKYRNCGRCHQQLSGKLVQLPDEPDKRYHWSCLLCHECQQPFQTTNVYLDSLKNIYHLKCAATSPTVEKACHHCKHRIFDQYLSIHIYVLHPECVRCCNCHNVLKPASIYCHKPQDSSKLGEDDNNQDNDVSIICRPCYQDQYTSAPTMNSTSNNNAHWLIVPQPLSVQHSASQLTYHSPATPTEHVASPAQVAPLPPIVQPSDLMSSKHYSNRLHRPLPQFGAVKICPGCQHRIASVHDECNGPRAAKWHRQCLVCCSCHKTLDSSAKVQPAPEGERLIPTCTTCLLQKQSSNQKRNSILIKDMCKAK